MNNRTIPTPKLTNRQGEVLNQIENHIIQYGFPPTRQDLCVLMGFRSPNAAEEHLRAIERKGYIELMQGVARGIRLLYEVKDAKPYRGAGVTVKKTETGILIDVAGSRVVLNKRQARAAQIGIGKLI